MILRPTTESEPAPDKHCDDCHKSGADVRERYGLYGTSSVSAVLCDECYTNLLDRTVHLRHPRRDTTERRRKDDVRTDYCERDENGNPIPGSCRCGYCTGELS